MEITFIVPAKAGTWTFAENYSAVFEMSDDSSPLYSALASDQDLQEIIRLFVDEMSDRIAAFEQYLASGSWEELGRVAHQLKGSAGSHGFIMLSHAAADVVTTIRSSAGQNEIAAATARLVALCRRITALPEPEGR
jgi:HPt (histidine-containing phosphotransfer) domain-containing protein